MKKRKKWFYYLLGVFILLIVANNIIFRFQFQEDEYLGSDLPENVLARFESKNSDEIINNLTKNDIVWMLTNPRMIQLKSKIIEYEYPYELRDADTNYVLISVSNASIEAWLKFLLLPNYTEFHILRIKDLIEIDRIVVPGYVREAKLGTGYIYLQPEFQVRKYGRIALKAK